MTTKLNPGNSHSDLRKLWSKGEAFFITCVVHAPYNGCFKEPQIWLVTPPGCEYTILNANQEPVIAWSLYASGDVDFIRSFPELVDKLGDREFGVHQGLISELPLHEHYWTNAIMRAASQIALPWRCTECGTEVRGCAPHHTGFRGNGGVGVFMEGALCDSCFGKGCAICRYNGDNDVYDTEVVEYGATLCERHTVELLRGAISGTEVLELLDDNECLELSKQGGSEFQLLYRGVPILRLNPLIEERLSLVLPQRLLIKYVVKTGV